MAFQKGQSGNPAGRPRIHPLSEEEVKIREIRASLATLEPPEVKEPPAVVVDQTEFVDKSLIDELQKSKEVPAFSVKPTFGYHTFQCYLGHLSYAKQKMERMQCLLCVAVALPLTAEQTCICSHLTSRHKGVTKDKTFIAYCLDCGTMQGDGGAKPRCERFNLSR